MSPAPQAADHPRVEIERNLWWSRVGISLVLFGLIVLAARPLFSAQYFATNDGLLHLFRLFALDQTLDQGVMYPRWLWDLAYGYGYPIFNYYPPLATYMAETLHLLGLTLPSAVQGVYVIVIAVAIMGAYAMGVELYSDDKNSKFIGILTAIGYVFFPYFLIDIFIRGALAEAVSAAVLPWLLWSWRRVLVKQDLGRVSLAGLILGIALVAHGLTLFVASPFLGLFLFWEWCRSPRANKLSALGRLFLAGLLGAGLSAIYWLPFVAEVSFVRMSRSNVLVSGIFQAHFQELSKVVQSSWVYQYGQAPFALALLPMLLSALALVLALSVAWKLDASGTIILSTLFAFGGAVAISEPLRAAWLAIPGTTMVQHPWRLEIVIGLGLAIAISALPTLFSLLVPTRIARITQFASTVIIGVVLVYSAQADLRPAELRFSSDELSDAQLARFEGYTGFVGGDTWSEYLPADLRVPSLSTYSAVKRSGPTGASANIELTRYDAQRRELAVSASAPISISLRAFAFPDWRVTIDDQPAPVYASTPMELLTVNVPVGNHRVVFVSDDTWPRRIGAGLSFSSLALLIGLTLLLIRRREAAARGVFVASLLLILFLAIPSSRALTAPANALQTRQVPVSPSLTLIGLRVEDAQLHPDGWHIRDARASLGLRVYWHVLAPLADNPFVWRLVDASGKVSSTSEQLARYGTGFAETWVQNEIVEDAYDLPITAISAGRYQLQVKSADSREYANVGAIELERGGAPLAPQPKIAQPIDGKIGERILLIGYDAPKTPHAGSQFPVTLFWRTEQNVYDDYTAFLQLIDSDGIVATKFDSVPGGGLSPTFLWRPGETVFERIMLQMPKDLAPGLYTLVAGLYHYPELERLPVFTAGERASDDVVHLGEFKVAVNAPDARPAHATSVTLGPAIRLSGYDLQVARDTLGFKLYWQVTARVDADYQVFAHVLDANGSVVAQIDRVPVDGKYPTRIWDAGERIVDAYALPIANLPAGEYTIVVGMYAPDTGERLSARDKDGNELPDRRVSLESFDLGQ